MAAHGPYVGLDLGPRYVGPGSHVPLNLGVSWDTDPPEPPEPVERGLRRSLGADWGLAAQARIAPQLRWSPGERQRPSIGAGWALAEQVRGARTFAWTDLPTIRHQLQLRWLGAMEVQHGGLHLRWNSLARERSAASLRWAQQQLQRVTVEKPWSGRPVPAHAAMTPCWRGGMPRLMVDRQLRWGHPTVTRRDRTLPWGPAQRIPWRVTPAPEPPVPPPEPLFPDGAHIGLRLGCPVVGRPGLVPLNLGIAACYAAQPRRRTYVVINDLAVVRIPDRTPIEVASVSISTAVDSWGSTFNIELADPAHLAYLKPTASGPRQIEVSLNGYTWTAIVESYGTQREFGRRVVTLTGRSRTALLAGPYAPTRAKVAGEPRSMAQLVAEELADTGFASTYDTVDWVVPEGAWYYDSTTALDAINALAEASGGVVQSDPTAQSLRVRARYPHSPRDWRDVTPDHRLLEDIVITESLQVRSAPLYDAVIVTGELAGKGVTCRVRRAGSDGQLYAPQVSSPLISEAAAGAERGRNILADRGEQAAIDLVLPLFAHPVQPGQTGRVLPLDLVEVVGADGTWHGQCTAARWEARAGEDGRVVVEQTITLERHYTDAD